MNFGPGSKVVLTVTGTPTHAETRVQGDTYVASNYPTLPNGPHDPADVDTGTTTVANAQDADANHSVYSETNGQLGDGEMAVMADRGDGSFTVTFEPGGMEYDTSTSPPQYWDTWQVALEGYQLIRPELHVVGTADITEGESDKLLYTIYSDETLSGPLPITARDPGTATNPAGGGVIFEGGTAGQALITMNANQSTAEVRGTAPTNGAVEWTRFKPIELVVDPNSPYARNPAFDPVAQAMLYNLTPLRAGDLPGTVLANTDDDNGDRQPDYSDLVRGATDGEVYAVATNTPQTGMNPGEAFLVSARGNMVKVWKDAARTARAEGQYGPGATDGETPPATVYVEFGSASTVVANPLFPGPSDKGVTLSMVDRNPAPNANHKVSERVATAVDVSFQLNDVEFYGAAPALTVGTAAKLDVAVFGPTNVQPSADGTMTFGGAYAAQKSYDGTTYTPFAAGDESFTFGTYTDMVMADYYFVPSVPGTGTATVTFEIPGIGTWTRTITATAS